MRRSHTIQAAIRRTILPYGHVDWFNRCARSRHVATGHSSGLPHQLPSVSTYRTPFLRTRAVNILNHNLRRRWIGSGVQPPGSRAIPTRRRLAALPTFAIR
jgi:hypothetical protein